MFGLHYFVLSALTLLQYTVVEWLREDFAWTKFLMEDKKIVNIVPKILGQTVEKPKDCLDLFSHGWSRG